MVVVDVVVLGVVDVLAEVVVVNLVVEAVVDDVLVGMVVVDVVVLGARHPFHGALEELRLLEMWQIP